MVEVSKRYLMQVAAHNLGVILHKLFGVGTPRGWGSAASSLLAAFGALVAALVAFWRSIVDFDTRTRDFAIGSAAPVFREHRFARFTPSSTGY